MKKSELALRTLGRAIAMDERNPLCKFHRASVLFATERHSDALRELEELKDIVPKESLVYFLIGKVHRKLGNTHLALINFSWAVDLDPKGTNNHIKEAIDKRYMADDDDASIAMSADPLTLSSAADPMEGPSHTSGPPGYGSGPPGHALAGPSHASLHPGQGSMPGASAFMDADEFQLRAVESDESL